MAIRRRRRKRGSDDSFIEIDDDMRAGREEEAEYWSDGPKDIEW